MKIVVLGGGQQGRVIAVDLARARPHDAITVADVREIALPELPNLQATEANLSDSGAIARLLAEYDMGVGALPSHLGFGAMRAAIAAKRPLVDVSFSAENPLSLDAEARAAGIAIVPDCGLAPGMSHLAVGRAAAEQKPDHVLIMVGGVAVDPTRPFGYVITWSIDDLLEEYVRPARVVRGGKPETIPALSGLERVQVEGVGEMESFYSDGLRTLVETLPGVDVMEEKTLRWPGHVEAITPLVVDGSLVATLREQCTEREPQDLVAMVVRVTAKGRGTEMTLIDRHDSATHLTAMSRTTALTTSVVAQLVASGGVKDHGVLPLEKIGADERAFRFIVDGLAARGVRPKWRAVEGVETGR